MSVLTKEQVEALRLSWVGGLDAIYDSHEALRAALTQSAEKLAEADARAIADYDRCIELVKQVARLERTVERMTEKVAEWRLRIREVARGSVELEALDDVSAAMLAASSPDHAGAQEGTDGQ